MNSARIPTISSPSHNAEGTSYYFLSDQGEVIYVPAGQDSTGRKFRNSLDDTRLPRPSTPATSSGRSSSLPSAASTLGDNTDKPSQPATSHLLCRNRPRLGLPKDWIIFPLSKGNHQRGTLHDPFNSPRHGWHLHRSSRRGRESTLDKFSSDFSDIDPKSIDYSRPLAFELHTENATPAPSYHSQQSSADTQSSPPPYPDPVSSLPQPHAGTTFKTPSLGQIAENRDESPDETVRKGSRRASSAPLFNTIQRLPTTDRRGNPELKHSRPLPQDFTDQQLHDIRRKTRHYIRVITRNSIGLTSTLALSGVAPQLLIAAAINAYCLGRGAHQLHEHLKFLKMHELKVRKRDVVLAVAEGVAVKVIFMAITINHDDFVVLAHEMFGSRAPELVDMVGGHAVPGFTAVNEAFIKPIEHVQEALGIPTMAQRAEDFEVGTIFGHSTWDTLNVSMLIENIFLVGSVQAGMEHGLDLVQDQFGKLMKLWRQKLEWKAKRRLDDADRILHRIDNTKSRDAKVGIKEMSMAVIPDKLIGLKQVKQRNGQGKEDGDGLAKK